MTGRDDLLRSTADTLLELPYDTWNFGDSIAFEAMVAASETLGDERWAAFAHGYGRAWAARARPYDRLDCTAPGHALVRVAVRRGDALLLAALCGLAGYLLDRPAIGGVFETFERAPLSHPHGPGRLSGRGAALVADPPAGVFVDCLHFDPPFLTALGAAVHEPRFWRAGLEQALGYVRLLQTPSGLFDHFVLRGEPGAFGPGWGRGQGWALLGLLDVLETADLLPLSGASDADLVAELRAAAAALAAAMIERQRADGHWYATVTDESSGEEFSTAAFMAAGLAKAARLGVAAAGAAVARRALAATLGGLDAAGTLREVSAAVGACTEPSHYVHVPRGFRVPWGQAPVVLALIEAAGP